MAGDILGWFSGSSLVRVTRHHWTLRKDQLHIQGIISLIGLNCFRVTVLYIVYLYLHPGHGARECFVPPKSTSFLFKTESWWPHLCGGKEMGGRFPSELDGNFPEWPSTSKDFQWTWYPLLQMESWGRAKSLLKWKMGHFSFNTWLVTAYRDHFFSFQTLERGSCSLIFLFCNSLKTFINTLVCIWFLSSRHYLNQK